MKRVASNGSVLVAVGSDSSGKVILVSKDRGDTWQATFVDERVRDVFWNGDPFVAVGGGIWSSHNGDNWTKDPVRFGESPYCGIGKREEIVLAGVDGMIMRAKRVTQPPAQGRVEND